MCPIQNKKVKGLFSLLKAMEDIANRLIFSKTFGESQLIGMLNFGESACKLLLLEVGVKTYANKFESPDEWI